MLQIQLWVCVCDRERSAANSAWDFPERVKIVLGWQRPPIIARWRLFKFFWSFLLQLLFSLRVNEMEKYGFWMLSGQVTVARGFFTINC